MRGDSGHPKVRRRALRLEHRVYGRLSVAKQADDLTELAIERQHERTVAYCHAKGWTPARFYHDVDSAYRRPGQKKAPPRPGFEQCLADVEAGLIGGIVFFKLDRFVRDRADFERALAVCEAHGAILASVTEPLDTSSPMGEAVASLLVTFARLESQQIGLRVGEQRQQAAKGGHPNSGGPRPFGWQPDRRTPDPREAAIIREVAGRLLAGEPLRAITADVNRRYGMKWPPANWRRILRAPRVAGMREHRGEVVATDAWPAILDPETWRQVNAVLRPRSDPADRPSTSWSVGSAGAVSAASSSTPALNAAALPGTCALSRPSIRAAGGSPSGPGCWTPMWSRRSSLP